MATNNVKVGVLLGYSALCVHHLSYVFIQDVTTHVLQAANCLWMATVENWHTHVCWLGVRKAPNISLTCI